ncbi:CDD/CDA-like deaminase [Novymonas esmeraldas]|uniref:CDD/CDA-like deaminase n=1 Tax=Novymonas esmeraldas TaxID=1808958 RepID=A0AAW0F702_9TRYP
MSELAAQTFNSIPFYKGYLPLKEAQQAQSYVVLALPVEQAALPYDDDVFIARSVGSTHLYSQVVAPPAEFPTTPVTDASDRHTPLLHPSTPGHRPLTDRSPLTHSRSSPTEHSRAPPAVTLGNSFAANSTSGTLGTSAGVAFFLFHKRDVEPPPIRFYVSPKKVHRCFLGCERTGCTCERIHFRPGAWRMRLDTLPRLPVTAARAGQNVRLAQSQIQPTAGYFFALGLKAAKVLPAVVPTMCRFNKSCRNGISCLYVHADKPVSPKQAQTSEISLRQWGQHVMADALSEDEMDAFYGFLDAQGIRTVGDMQVLGNTAFDSLAARVAPRWAEAFLTLSALRDVDTKTPLQTALLAFPRVEAPVVLPAFLKTVGDLLNLTALAFAQLQVAPFVMDACALVRSRCGNDEAFNIIDLKKEDPDSFFSKATRMILNFCRVRAHCSWRKHDPTRPVVTSVLTFVDVNTCRCHRNGDNLHNTAQEQIEAPIPSDIEEMGTPRGSWCQCMRRGVIAVNYELSTPSGSRCSEQNAMGKLAALGVPTWGVREVFVHGMNVNKEANPLFPCGVCENMLQKVTKDVLAHYGGDVTLYMFDATAPRKIVFLTIPEISNRDGANFKKFVAEDLRDRLQP